MDSEGENEAPGTSAATRIEEAVSKARVTLGAHSRSTSKSSSPGPSTSRCHPDERRARIEEAVDRGRRLLSVGRVSRSPVDVHHSPSPGPSTSSSSVLAGRRMHFPPTFKPVDFDDMVDDEIRDRKPAWKQWQESITDSYAKARRTVERSRSEYDVLSNTLPNRRRRAGNLDPDKRDSRETSPFAHLDSESLTVRPPSWFASGAMQPRGMRYGSPTSSDVQAPITSGGPYAAPAVGSTQGIEHRQSKAVDAIEQRLLRMSILPARMRVSTVRDFRHAPEPAPGSATEAADTDTELSLYAPKPYYSRPPNRDDPDYFDFDLNHSVDMYRHPAGKYVPRGPQEWERKIMSELGSKGSAPLSGHMFAREQPDYRNTTTGYLSAALRTPSFWEKRFSAMGKEIRDSNPVSMDSIMRNKPTPSRFTEYKDPDFEDYDDGADSD